MRGAGNHIPPSTMLPAIPDNTSDYVFGHVNLWARTSHERSVIHYEAAREIAAWWQTPSNAFGVFASTGGIRGSLNAEIQREIDCFRADIFASENVAEQMQHLFALYALKAYINAVGEKR